MISLIRRIIKVSGKYKRRIQTAFVFSFLKSMLSKAPIGLAFIVFSAFIEKTADGKLCIAVGIAMAGCVILQTIFQHAADRLQSAAGFMVFADKRMELGRHLRKMPMGYFTEGNIGKISSVLSTDMGFIEENCMTALADMMSEIFAEVIMVVFLFFLSPWLGIAGFVILGIVMLVGNRLHHIEMKNSTVRQEQSENLTEAVLDFTEGISIIKTYNLLGEKSKELTDNFRKSREKSLEFERDVVPCMRWINLLLGTGSAVILAVAMIINAKGMLSVSYLIGLLLFVFDLFGPVRALYGSSTRLTVMSSCLDRVEEVFQESELADDGTDKIPEKSNAPEIEFKNVNFAYDKKEVLHDISFCLEKNQMCALVGPSGGGKSTVANLLARFWDVKSGQIFVRGKDIREIPLTDLMDHISMVFQRVYLFQDTIYNNISMGRPDATREEIIEAAKKARCYDFIMKLPQGFDTVIGEGGESLSGGEKQRISIARCILKDAPIVILDEATASVDADNERYIQEAISELCQGKTLLVIAHRLNTIREADQILVISKGTIEERGTHQQLMEKAGIYRRFVFGRQKAIKWQL
ncbi:MAG: ABC transporter ATP-binding protein [Eubacterium sp.]